MTKIDPKMTKIKQMDPKISKKCTSYCKIPTEDKNGGLPLKLLLLVPKPTGKLLPSFRHNLHLCLSGGTNVGGHLSRGTLVQGDKCHTTLYVRRVS